MSRQVAGKIAISLFILFTFVIWIWRNTPAWFDRWYWQTVDSHAPASVAGVLHEIPLKLNWVAHRQGLSNKWEMYSSVWRNDYGIIVYGIDANGSRVLLPEPLQSPRTWWEREFVDFREPKFHIHLLRWPSELDRYARFLLRRYPEHNGIPIRSIEMDLQWRSYVENTYDAVRTGSHFGAPLRTVPLYPPSTMSKTVAVTAPATQPASPAPLPSTTQPSTQPAMMPATLPSTEPATRPESEREQS